MLPVASSPLPPQKSGYLQTAFFLAISGPFREKGMALPRARKLTQNSDNPGGPILDQSFECVRFIEASFLVIIQDCSASLKSAFCSCLAFVRASPASSACGCLAMEGDGEGLETLPRQGSRVYKLVG